MPLDVVLGAGGKTGQETVKCLLKQGSNVRAVARNPEKLKALLPQDGKLEVAAGDVTDVASLKTALSGARGVVFAASGSGYWSAKAVDEQGVGNTAAAAKEAGVERVVLVSSALVTSKNRFHPIRIILNNIRWGLMDAKLQGEELLRRSGVPYTIVRPGGLTDGAPNQAHLKAEQGDTGSAGRIARSDVAAICAAALTSPEAKNVTLEVSSSSSDPPLQNQLQNFFNGLLPDR